MERNHAIEVYGANTKLINLTLYDNGQGIAFRDSAADSEAYGNLVFNNGWIAQDRGHGHGVHTKNSTGLKIFRDNLLLQQFGYTFHAYDTTAELNRFLLDRNSMFGGSVLVGGQSAQDITVENNRFYQTTIEMGHSSTDNAGLYFDNNYVAGGVALQRWSNARMTGNTIYPVNQDGQLVTLDVTFRPHVGILPDYQVTNNAYFKGSGRGGSDFSFLDAAGVPHNSTFAMWQQAGFDLHSTYHSNSPNNIQVFLERNHYEPERAHLTIYNWPRQPVVQVDVSNMGVQIGDVLELSNAFNYFNESTLIVYDGGPIAIPMTGWTIAMPLGYPQPLTASPFPEFGVFVLRKLPRGVSVNINPRSATLKASQQQQLSTSIAGTANSRVVWTVSPAIGSVSPSGLYTAPASIASEITVIVTGTSATDPTQSATCKIRLIPDLSVTLTPANALVGPGDNQAVDVQVSGTNDNRVTWTMQPMVGTLSSTGQYTAPSSITKRQTITITATSVVDLTQSGSSAMTLLPGVGGGITPDSSTEQVISLGLLGAASSSVGQPLTAATTTGLVGYWSLDESSGNTAADSSGKGYNGTLVNSPAWTNGKINRALSLNGNNQFVNVGASSAFNLTGDMTAAAWVNHTDSNGADLILGKGSCYGSFCPFGIRIDSGDNLCFDQGNGTSGQDSLCTTGARVTLGQWIHIAVVRSGAQRRIYINGSLAASSSTRAKAPTANSAPLLIGNSLLTASDYFNGALDEVRIFNRALTAVEISGIYTDSGGSTPSPSDITPPVISSVLASNITGSGATISWTTNELADTQVEYGTTTAYGKATGLNTFLATAHSATLSGLTAGTIYNHRVKSRDAAGNLTVSNNQTFTTPSSTTPPPPTSGGNQWYASTNGTSSGNGSQASPWNLSTAITGGRGLVKPGDTIWVRGGTYRGRFASTMSGTAQQPIIIRAYPNERVTIDGRFETSVTAPVPSGSPNSNVSISVADMSGFAGNMPNSPMSVRLQYIPSGSTKLVEETLLVLSVGPTSITARRSPCTQFGGTCPSFPAGAMAVATGVEHLRAYGAYTWIWGVEVMYSQDNHVMGGPLWPNFQGAVSERCTGCKFINMIIHDSGANGIFSGAAGQGTEIYGNLIYYNGADDLAARAHGHGVYAQNTQNGPTKYIIDNFFFRSFQFGNQIYGSSSAYLDNFHVEGNTYFKAGEPTHEVAKGQFIIGDAGVFKNHVFKDNMLYATADVGIDIGYGGSVSSPECKSPTITGNYLIHTVANETTLKVTCSTPTITGNTIHGKLRDITASAYPNNTYLTSLSGQKIFVRPNKYEVGRANVTIYNWSKAASASVDISKTGLNSGDRYQVRDVQNYFGPPVASGTYNGSAITVPLNNTAVAQPIGKIAVAPIKHTSSEFNAFVIVKVP